MKFSYNWICELVEDLAMEPQALSQLITMKTAECEGVERYGEHLQAVCAAAVEEVHPIPGSHNIKAVVETARYGKKTVVCGAANCRPGILTAYVPPGVKLAGREIGAVEIAGVRSEGMLASGAELGLNRDAEGILELAGEPGGPIPGCETDHVIEIDNKSITHRPDLWGHHGMAREVAAIARLGLRDPADLRRIPAAPAPISVTIQDYTLCPRYSGLVFENVKVQPSPLWLQYRLESIGLNPINNIVDVTNYVMAELAQPMHAFDRALLHGAGIIVRRAEPGEEIAALNGETYPLNPATLVIADANGPIALAGIIGGSHSAIGGNTTGIILESANFHAATIRKASSRLKLRTDASMRFEKSQDPINTVRALARAVELLEVVSPGIRLVGGLADAGREWTAPMPILLPLDWLHKKLGRAVAADEVRDILTRLQFDVAEPSPALFSVSVPSWRATKDIATKDDLVEEIGRMVGYSSITPAAPLTPTVVPPSDPDRLYMRALRQRMTALGFTEVHNYSFVSEEQIRAFGWEPSSHLAVGNPIAADQAFMRRSLLPGIRKNIVENARHFETFRLFEIGHAIIPQQEGLPEERPHLAAACFARPGGPELLFDLKHAAESLLPGCEVAPGAAHSHEHPARAAEIRWDGHTVGRLFELHPNLAPQGRAAILDLDLPAICLLPLPRKRFRPIRRFPSSAFDLSVIAEARDLAGNLERKLRQFAGEALERIEFLRVYSGPPIPDGSKSVSFRLTVAAADHTLSLEEVGQIRTRLIEGMRAEGYELRV